MLLDIFVLDEEGEISVDVMPSVAVITFICDGAKCELDVVP